MEKKINHAINGCILQEGKVYIPLTEIISLCFKYPTLTGKQMMLLFEDANKRLGSKLQEHPKQVKKSLWRKLFA